jgi:tetratricopeptide (TPR) repeat protein
MKRAAVVLAISLAVFAGALSSGQTAQQNPGAGQAPAPAAKRPPQAKTQPEYDAWKAASGNNDPAAMEKAAEDFEAKFPASELRILLYRNAMRLYQNSDNAAKSEAMGRKVLSFDGDDPEGLVVVAFAIIKRTHDTDLDRDQRFAEATSLSQKALQTIDTDISVPGAPQDKIDAYKALLRSQAYSIIGTIAYDKENYAVAQDNLQKSIDADPSDPQPADILRLALALDKQQKYPEALKWANRAVEMTQENTAIGTPARSERDRLQALTGGAAPAPPQTAPKN